MSILIFPAEILLHHLRPRGQHLGVPVGDRRQEVVQFQGDLRLGESRAGNRGGGNGATGNSEELASRNGQMSPPGLQHALEDLRLFSTVRPMLALMLF